MLIDVRCQNEQCRKLLCRITKQSFGVIFLKCARCGKDNEISLAQVLREKRRVGQS